MDTILPKISGNAVKEAVEWLKKEDCGCYHFHIADTDFYSMHICIGWHDCGDEWKIAWKIGMESFQNVMQADFDIDFIMPWDEKSGDVYDTVCVIEDTAETDWNAMADDMNDTAKKVVEWQMEQEFWKKADIEEGW